MPWAIYDDLSGVVELGDHGIHATEMNAINALIYRLESDRTEIVDKIAKAKRRRRALRKQSKA